MLLVKDTDDVEFTTDMKPACEGSEDDNNKNDIQTELRIFLWISQDLHKIDYCRQHTVGQVLNASMQ